ncbi:hypothetical protein B9Z55_022417 [Caenorhabditis nigoni]|uniref:Uncharacterized protein n=1 Tax=Caenorhabditis nigoni TaxID=1611254 RepID=A0A2G5SKA4_9PELO|nr:hypothetical protein B9Z55_022417 [Caenorhabditis nigoni]
MSDSHANVATSVAQLIPPVSTPLVPAMNLSSVVPATGATNAADRSNVLGKIVFETEAEHKAYEAMETARILCRNKVFQKFKNVRKMIKLVSRAEDFDPADQHTRTLFLLMVQVGCIQTESMQRFKVFCDLLMRSSKRCRKYKFEQLNKAYN